MRHKYRRACRQKETLLIPKEKLAEKLFLGFAIYRPLSNEFHAFSSPKGFQTR
jgi:hypothetical protein